MERADRRLIGEIEGLEEFIIEPMRDHFDYVYRREDLVNLAGRKYHSKRNQLTKFRNLHPFLYVPLDSDNLKTCLELSGFWCEIRRCEEDLNLTGEWGAIQEALNSFQQLQIRDGTIVLEDKVEAFALGEMLNETTAVVHLEKANPQIPGLYALINQQFCEKEWVSSFFLDQSRQDLGSRVCGRPSCPIIRII